MDRNDRLGTCSYPCFDQLWTDVISLLIRLYGYGSRPRIGDRQPSRNEGIARDDHFIPFSNAISAKDQMERIQAVPYADTIFYIAIGRKFLLKGLNLLAQYISPRLHHTPGRIIELMVKLEIRRL